MWARIATGAVALGLYGWRIDDPKGSYAAFYDASDWLTGWVVSGEGVWHYLRNTINLILVDQADGFLLGMAVMAFLSLLAWPARITARYFTRKLINSGK